MKKKYKTKRVMRLLITLMLMATLLLGCSSTEAETETAEAKPEVEAPAEEPAEVEEEDPAEETKPEEPELAQAETETGTETTEEEPAEVEEEAPAEESTEPQISEEPVELIDLANYGGELSNYIDSLDPDKPAIIIFNQLGGYVINMQEGQYYQLKSEDEIIFNYTGYGYGSNPDLCNSIIEADNFTIYKIDYSKMQPKQEFFLKKLLDSGEIIQLTCYFDPPTE